MIASELEAASDGEIVTPEESEIQAAHTFVTERLDRPATIETFRKRLKPIHARLIEIAENGETISYSELARAGNTSHRAYLSTVLCGIAHIERERGHPPLTVLVVQQENERPSDGFSILLEELDIKHEYSTGNGDVNTESIMQEVWEYYQHES